MILAEGWDELSGRALDSHPTERFLCIFEGLINSIRKSKEMIAFILFFLVLCGRNVGAQITSSPPPDTLYIAAKYSCLIDMAIVNELIPIGMLNNFISYQYYIQYGENVTIQILVPDHEKEYLPVRIETWDYNEGTLTQEYIFNHTRKYRISTDSILHTKEESVGVVEPLCDLQVVVLACDSVLITSKSTNIEYQVYFDDRLDNISSRDLFYPNIQRLPSKIIKNDPQKATRIREEMMYGKPSIDSLIQFYNHEGYERITDEEWFSAIHLLPNEVKEMFLDYMIRYKERMKE